MDGLSNQREINQRLSQEINYLFSKGKSKQEILDLFRTEILTEEQSNDAMIDSHRDYVEMIAAILDS